MTIVVGYVPKPEGRAAFEQALYEAALRGARLLVLNASRGDAYLDDSYAQQPEMDTVRRRLEELGIEHEVRQPIGGKDAADEIVAVAEEVGADLIVIGLRRRSPVGKLIMGSNAQRVLLDAPCPVLAVKAGAPEVVASSAIAPKQ